MLATTIAAVALAPALLLPAHAPTAEPVAAPAVTVTAPAKAKHHTTSAHRKHRQHLHHLHVLHLRHQAKKRANRNAASARAKALREARSWIGTRYRYGGHTRAGTDCSGFTQAVMRAVGKKIPRTAAAQLAAGRRVRTPRVGDLAFYNPGHVVFVAAVRRGRVVLTIAAKHTGTRVSFQKPYAPLIVRSYLA